MDKEVIKNSLASTRSDVPFEALSEEEAEIVQDYSDGLLRDLKANNLAIINTEGLEERVALMAKIIIPLCDRYLLLSPKEHTRKMLETLKVMAPEWPIDKSNRWLGFIQGRLEAEGLLIVNDEREATRSVFHEYYEATGQAIPKSAALKATVE